MHVEDNMPKGAVESAEVATTATRIRDQIRELEIGVVALRGRGEGVVDLLRMRDELEVTVERYEAAGSDLRPERTRLETVDNIIMRKAAEIGRELARVGGLEGVRRRENPPEEHWWWYVDLYHAERQRKALTRGLITVGVIVVLLLAVNLVMDRFFGLDPVEKEARSFTTAGEQLLIQGEYSEAIAEYEQALTVLPTLADARITLGVLYELTGRSEDAESAYRAAREVLQDEASFLLIQGKMYEMVGEYDKALAAVEGAIALKPDSSEAYLNRGSAYESKGEFDKALSDYEKASSLAQAQQQDTLYVMARTRLAMLLQRGSGFGPTGAGMQ